MSIQNGVRLTDNLLLGRGAHRACYSHPGNLNLCIKIVYNKSDGGVKELRRELRFYKDMERRLTDWSSITRYYGKVNTNLGMGYVFDRIINKDGTPSTTLESYLKIKEDLREIDGVLFNLYGYIKKNKIPTMTIKAQNILCQMDDNSIKRLVIVDNLGDSTFISFSKFSNRIFNKRLDKKWDKFMRSIGIC